MNKNKYFLEIALKEAELALQENTYPVGAVIVDENYLIVAKGRNQVHPHQDATAHAEITAIQHAGSTILAAKTSGKHLTLYTSLEPCLMCTGAVLFANIKRVVWVLNDGSGFGGFNKTKRANIFADKFNKIDAIEEPFEDLKQRQKELMERWMKNTNNIVNLRKALK